jgi:hypothetical protein
MIGGQEKSSDVKVKVKVIHDMHRNLQMGGEGTAPTH